MLSTEAPTYDVFLSHNGADKPLVQRVAERLRQMGIEPWFDAWKLTPGASWQPELVAGLQASAACAVFIGPHGLGDWAREELALAQDRAAKDHSFRLFMVLLPGAPDVFDPSLAFLRTRTWVDLRDSVVNPTGLQDLVCAIRGVARPAPSVADTGEETCPYRGLEAFDEAHASFFFGREDDTARVLEKLKASRFLAVLGPSGSGKSSLVRAGALPALRCGAVPGSEHWRIAVMVPGPRPLAGLAAQLAQLPGAEAMQRTVDGLATDERTLDLAVTLGMAEGGPHDHTLLVVDQFEELFTLCPDEEERKAFLANLTYAATIPGGRLVVILAMRADFYARCANYPELRDLVAASQFLVGPLDRDELRRAVEEPARAVGLELEAGLVETILNDVADRPGTLPLLEHVLLEVWRRRRGRMLTVEAYVESGGVEGALAQRANTVYESLTSAQQALARRVLLRLVQPGEGTEDTRRRAGERELLTRPDEEPDLDAVVSALAAQRLLTTSRDEASGEAVLDLTHEALIRGWPELRGWINEDREALRAQRRLTEAATEWEEAGRDEALLFRGARLLAWSERSTEGLSELEREFLAESNERRNRERAARRRAVRLVIAGLTAGLVAITVVAVVAVGERAKAVHERDRALSRQLATDARVQLDIDPERSLLLGRLAYQRSPTPEAEAVVRQAVTDSRVRATLEAHRGTVASVALHPIEERAVTAGSDGSIRVVDLSGKRRLVVVGEHEQGATAAEFSPDGHLVVSGGSDDAIRVWDWRTRETVQRISAEQEGVASVAFHPKERRWASGGADGTVLLWDETGGRQPLEGLRHEKGKIVFAVAFSPDGRFLVSAGEDGAVRLFDFEGGAARELARLDGDVYGVAFDPASRRVATAGRDRKVRVWNVETPSGDPIVLAGHEGIVRGVAFGPGDGRRLASASDDGTVRIWDLDAPSSPPVVLAGHAVGVRQVRFMSDGRRVVSCADDGSVKVWAWAGSADAVDLERHDDTVWTVALSGDGRVLTASKDGTAKVQALSGAGIPVKLQGHSETVYAASFSGDGEQVVTAGKDGTVRVWDSRRGSQLQGLEGHEGDVYAAAFTPDGRRVMSAGLDGTVRIWDWKGNKVLAMVKELNSILSAAFSPDGHRVAMAVGDGTVRVWDWRRPRRASLVLQGHKGGVYGVGFSSDGTRVVSGGADRTVRVWDWRAGTAVVLRGHRGTVWGVAFVPDAEGMGEERVVSAGDDGTVRGWRASGGASLVLERRESAAYSAVVDLTGRQVVAAFGDGIIRRLGCEACGPRFEEDVLPLAEKRSTRELSSEERRRLLRSGGAG